MGKSFISYEFSPAERLLLLRGIHLMLSDLYEEIYFFGFYDEEENDENDEKENVVGFLSNEEDDEEDDEDEDETEESNFFEDPKEYKYDFGGKNENDLDGDEDEDEEMRKFFEDDFEDDFDDIFDDDWRVDRFQMDKLINEIKVLENKLIKMDSEDDFPELDINELEILLDSAYEVKIKIDEDEQEEELDWDESNPEVEALHNEIRDTINNLGNEDKKQIEEDYEYLVLRQHKDLSSLIYKIKEWIDNYQINSN